MACIEKLRMRKLVDPRSIIWSSHGLLPVSSCGEENRRRLYQTDDPIKIRTISVLADTTWDTVEICENPLFVIAQVAWDMTFQCSKAAPVIPVPRVHAEANRQLRNASYDLC